VLAVLAAATLALVAAAGATLTLFLGIALGIGVMNDRIGRFAASMTPAFPSPGAASPAEDR
jgi:hypothetical protein